MNTVISDKLLNAFFNDKNTLFPNKPRLVKEISCYEAPYGLGIQFRGGPRKVVLKGKGHEAIFNELIKYLNGSYELDTIFSLMTSSFSMNDVASLLRTLHINGLLVDDIEVESQEEKKSSVEYYNRIVSKTGFKKSGIEVVEAIGHSRVFFIVTKDLISPMLLYIEAVGLRNVGLLSLDLSEKELNNYFDTKDHPRITFWHSALDFDSKKTLETIYNYVDNYNLIVTSLNNASRDFLLSINRIGLMKDKPMFFLNRLVNSFEVGPYILPNRSSCYSCCVLRKNSYNNDSLFENIYQDGLTKNGKSIDTSILGWDEVSSFTAFGFLISDLVRSITGIDAPKLLNRIIDYNTLVGSFVESNVIRVPACPQCGSAQLGSI